METKSDCRFDVTSGIQLATGICHVACSRPHPRCFRRTGDIGERIDRLVSICACLCGSRPRRFFIVDLCQCKSRIAAHLCLAGRFGRFDHVFPVSRECQRCEKTDNSHNDHELNKCKTFAYPALHTPPQFCTSAWHTPPLSSTARDRLGTPAYKPIALILRTTQLLLAQIKRTRQLAGSLTNGIGRFLVTDEKKTAANGITGWCKPRWTSHR